MSVRMNGSAYHPAQLRIECIVYLCGFALEIYTLGVHDIQQHLEGDNDVRVDDRSCLVTLFLGKPSAMNDSHLLDDG